MSCPVEVTEVAERIGMAREEANDHIAFFKQLRYFQTTLAGAVILNARGVQAAERLTRSRPSRSLSVVLSVQERRDLEAVLCEVDRADVAARLAGDALAKFEANRDTITAQLRSPEPSARSS